MVYILINNETGEGKVYKKATQVADVLGLSTQTIWNHSKKMSIVRGKYTLYYAKEGLIKVRTYLKPKHFMK